MMSHGMKFSQFTQEICKQVHSHYLEQRFGFPCKNRQCKDQGKEKCRKYRIQASHQCPCNQLNILKSDIDSMQVCQRETATVTSTEAC
ncbi:hypothetical protein Y1Q_0001345 [Alligator mississippiensis]|uniref:Uncharacterized protein n=1 Tax=Alligator mississippiensis TaxID=8496 RepID=A0A151M9B0_ALLMI|nr:hypothetical protein Y1Q_0001345 [Alligator mississippiensis]